MMLLCMVVVCFTLPGCSMHYYAWLSVYFQVMWLNYKILLYVAASMRKSDEIATVVKTVLYFTLYGGGL